MRICIVSPHLDDAILSCGIMIQRRLAAGDSVFVLNIFSSGTNAGNRRREDFDAMEKIGATPFFLDELDAPDRDPVYKSDIRLFFGPLDPAAPIVGTVSERLKDFFSVHRIDRAVFPLAAGTHIDHRIAFEAGRRIGGIETRFYEDRPYILWPGILQGRMNQIGCDAALPTVTPAEMQATLDGFHHLRHFVPKGAFREQCLPHYFSALTPPPRFSLRGTPEELTATEAETERLYASLACYESQMPFIYPDRDLFLRDSLAYEQANSGRAVYVERSWSLQA